MILIHPPLVKPSEPPPGIAKLFGALSGYGVPCRLVDANLEGILYLLAREVSPPDTWGRRAASSVRRNIASLRAMDAYRSPDRYKRAVTDLSRVLEMAAADTGVCMGLANYRHRSLSPVKSADLIRAAAEPEMNPFYPYFRERLSAVIAEAAPALVGISLNYLSQALSAFAMIGYLRKEHPGLRIVLGGGLVTSWMRNPGWKMPFAGLVDHLVAGPGETALLALAGIEEGEPTRTRPRYDVLPMAHYFAPGPVLPYSASSGCYWNRCAFCPERAERNPYAKTPDRTVIEDLASLTAEVKPSLIHLVDNALSPSLMRTLAQTPPGAPWYGFARITEDLADPDFCMALKRSGCAMLKVGLESGDQGVLDAMDKGVDLNVASVALGALKKAGIATYVYLLFGTPSETEREAQRTLSFTAAHADLIDFLNVAVFNLPAHAPEERLLDTEPFYEGDLCLYRAFVHPKGWDRRRVRLFLDRRFRKEPAIAAILRRDPPFFTSNHAPFFSLATGFF